jgi:hypothetical protein
MFLMIESTNFANSYILYHSEKKMQRKGAFKQLRYLRVRENQRTSIIIRNLGK